MAYRTEEQEVINWTDFLLDMTNYQYKQFQKLSQAAQQKAFSYWLKTEGQHIDYAFPEYY